jgi:hypothetical protein
MSFRCSRLSFDLFPLLSLIANHFVPCKIECTNDWIAPIYTLIWNPHIHVLRNNSGLLSVALYFIGLVNGFPLVHTVVVFHCSFILLYADSLREAAKNCLMNSWIAGLTTDWVHMYVVLQVGLGVHTIQNAWPNRPTHVGSYRGRIQRIGAPAVD